jgi:hypothetical protein
MTPRTATIRFGDKVRIKCSLGEERTVTGFVEYADRQLVGIWEKDDDGGFILMHVCVYESDVFTVLSRKERQ